MGRFEHAVFEIWSVSGAFLEILGCKFLVGWLGWEWLGNLRSFTLEASAVRVNRAVKVFIVVYF